MFGEGAARALGVITFAILARALGVGRFGIFSLAMGLAAILGLIIDLGQNYHLGRLVARDTRKGPFLFRWVLLNKLCLTLLVGLVAWLATSMLGVGATTRVTIVLMCGWAGILGVLDSLRMITRSLGWMRADSLVNALESLGRLGGVLVAWSVGWGLAGYGFMFVAEASLAALAYGWWLSTKVNLKPDSPEKWYLASYSLLRRSLPLGLAGLATAGFYRIDQVMIVPLVGPAANGLYGAASRIVFTATVAAALIAVAAYPRLAATSDDPSRFSSAYRRALFYCAGIGLCLSIVVAVVAGPLVKLMYGAEFLGAVPLLRVLAAVVALNGLSVLGIYAMAALGLEKTTLVAVTALLCLNIVGNWLLLPIFGVWVAVYLSVAGEGLLAGFVVFVSWRKSQVARTLPSVAQPNSCDSRRAAYARVTNERL